MSPTFLPSPLKASDFGQASDIKETIRSASEEIPAEELSADSKPSASSESESPESEAADELDPDAIIEASGEVVEDDTGFALEDVPVRSNERALARVDALQLYMQEVQRHPLLTPEEEHRLAEQYVKTGDVNAAARLVTANLRLVVKLAFEYRRAYRNIMDLIQEGNIGLMQAVKRYDPYRGVKLSSYAAWWIRAYILRFILNNWRLVKLGTTQAQRKLFFNLNKEKARLAAMGIEPTHAGDRIAPECGRKGRCRNGSPPGERRCVSRRECRRLRRAANDADGFVACRARRVPINSPKASNCRAWCASNSTTFALHFPARNSSFSTNDWWPRIRSRCRNWATNSAYRASACGNSKRG